MRVAYTVEQCWHRVPGGTAVAALEVARELSGHGEVDLRMVAGHHRARPLPPWDPPGRVHHLPRPWSGPLLYEGWLRLGRPRVESATGPVDVAHATTVLPCATRAPLVATVHDLAFLHDPAHFTARGVSVFRRSLEQLRRRAALVLASSSVTADDLVAAGVEQDRIRLVPLGVRPVQVSPDEVSGVRGRLELPERFALFVGTVEPRKNLARLVTALSLLDEPLPLIVAGAPGWGDARPTGQGTDVRFVGFVDPNDLPALYAAAEVLCLPSIREGYGLPVLEAMSHGVPVVTSRGTSTEEVAGGAAVLVDPLDPVDIARGISDALERRDELSRAGRRRAAACPWSSTAALTAAAYREVAG